MGLIQQTFVDVHVFLLSVFTLMTDINQSHSITITLHSKLNITSFLNNIINAT